MSRFSMDSYNAAFCIRHTVYIKIHTYIMISMSFSQTAREFISTPYDVARVCFVVRPLIGDREVIFIQRKRMIRWTHTVRV